MAKRKRVAEKQTQQVVVELPSVPLVAGDRPDAQEIARMAHQYWLERGSPIGTPEEDWFRAEEEFRMRRRQSEPERNHC
jgi:hypothetical protein